MSEIFREIDEELRRDNLAKLWARYGRYLIAIVVVILLATAGITSWRKHQEDQRRADSVRYAAALDLVGREKFAEAADSFALLAADAGGKTATLAKLQEAGARSRAGDDDAASRIYKSLAEDGSTEAPYHDLALLLAGLHDLAKADPKAVQSEIAPLTVAGNPWRASALEITALAQLRAGDRAAARETYTKISDDLTGPAGLRARAAEMSAALAD